MPLKDLKRTIHEKKFYMQEKINILLSVYNEYMDNLIK